MVFAPRSPNIGDLVQGENLQISGGVGMSDLSSSISRFSYHLLIYTDSATSHRLDLDLYRKCKQHVSNCVILLFIVKIVTFPGDQTQYE